MRVRYFVAKVTMFSEEKVLFQEFSYNIVRITLKIKIIFSKESHILRIRAEKFVINENMLRIKN